MSDMKPTAEGGWMAAYRRADEAYWNATEQDDPEPVRAAVHIAYTDGFAAGVAAERARIVALLHTEAEDAKASRYWDFVDAFQRSAAVIERAS